MFTSSLVVALSVLPARSGVRLGSQIQIVTIETPFHSAGLAGQVFDPSRAGLPDVLVERCEAGWKQRFAEAHTNKRGQFKFSGVRSGTHYLKLTKDGFDPLQITIIINSKVKHKLRLDLPIAN